MEQKEEVIVDLRKAQAELQNYSKNLEKMVEERTQEVRKLNVTITAMSDTIRNIIIIVKEGFNFFVQFVFNSLLLLA